MSRWRWLALALVCGLAVIPAGTVFTGETDDLIFDETLCPDCGLDKLTDAELLGLISAIRGLDSRSYLEPAAFQYLRKNDWRPTDVLGYRNYQHRSSSLQTRVMVVLCEGQISLLEPSAFAEKLNPGTYWSKGSTMWEIMLPDGETDDYWLRETFE